jgi:hypothetical protein
MQFASMASGELDEDTLHAVLQRVVAPAPSGLAVDQPGHGRGAAAHLVRCACVCRLWYAGAVHDGLWRAVLLQAWGVGAQQLLDWQAATPADNPALPCRAQYMCGPARSPPTAPLLWTQSAHGCARARAGV